MAIYAGLAIYVMNGVLFHSSTRTLQNSADGTTFEWMLTTVAQHVIHLQNPLFSTAMNAPGGVNLMANPSVPVYGILLTPLTLAAGAATSFVLLLTVNLFATAAAWRWFFLRHPAPAEGVSARGHQAAATLGGALCGFSAAMLAHSQGHVNLTSQWLLPLIVDRVFALRTPGKSVRAGLVLGLLVVVQMGIAEELVFITALVLGIIIAIQAVTHRQQTIAEAPAFLRGAGAALAVAAPLLAYPLWLQFKGPGSYTGFPWPIANFGANIQTYLDYSPLSVGGNSASALPLIANITEASAFIGWPLILLATVIAVTRWRNSAIRTAAITALIIGLLSLGLSAKFGTDTLLNHHMPWHYLADLPLFATALPIRLSFALFPLLAYILVAQLTDLLRYAHDPRSRRLLPAAFLAVTAALAPGFPEPTATQPRPAAPAFYADGLWRQCVQPGGTLIAFPFGYTAMRWQTAANLGFDIVGGNYFGPGPGTRAFGQPDYRATGNLLVQVDQTGTVPAVTPAMQTQAHADATYWHADCVALFGYQSSIDTSDIPLAHPQADQELLTALYGPGRYIGGVWTWSTGN